MSTGFKPLYESPLRNQCTAPPKYSRYLRASLRAAFPDYRSKACGRVEKRPIAYSRAASQEDPLA